MTALATDRNTKSKAIQLSTANDVIAAHVIYGGAMVVAVATGYRSAADMAGVIGARVVGVSDYRVDNSAGAAGAKKLRVRRGVFKFGKTGAITVADIGKDVYVADDQTVQVATGTNSVVAGELLELDEDGDVWVQIPSNRGAAGAVGPTGPAGP